MAIATAMLDKTSGLAASPQVYTTLTLALLLSAAGVWVSAVTGFAQGLGIIGFMVSPGVPLSPACCQKRCGSRSKAGQFSQLRRLICLRLLPAPAPAFFFFVQVCVPWMLSRPATPENLRARRRLFAGAALSQVRAQVAGCRGCACVRLPARRPARPPTCLQAGMHGLTPAPLQSLDHAYSSLCFRPLAGPAGGTPGARGAGSAPGRPVHRLWRHGM